MKTGGQATRAAIYRDSFPIAVGVKARLRNMFEVKSHVVGNKKSEMGVINETKEGTAGAPSRRIIGQTRLHRNIRKSSVAVIAVQDVLAEVGDEQVFIAVIIVIAHAHRRGPARFSQPGFFGDFTECAIAIVFIQTICRGWWVSFDARAAPEEKVHHAVGAVVEDRAATTHHL